MTINFPHAFDRWFKVAERERERLRTEQTAGRPVLSWEAADHLCGLAVESGLKALMLASRMVSSDGSGDFPKKPGSDRRPHVDELWDWFMSSASGRTQSEWVKRLGGGKAPASVFRAWRAEHRYATDGTVGETTFQARWEVARRLKSIAEEEGL